MLSLGYVKQLLEDPSKGRFGIYGIGRLLTGPAGLITSSSLRAAVSDWNDHNFRYNAVVWHTNSPVGNNCYAFRNFLIARFQLTTYNAALPSSR